MCRVRRTAGLGGVVIALLWAVAPVRAQWIEPSGGDPVVVACPHGPASGNGINPLEAWQKAKEIASIEGDGFLGIGNWGHTLEALEWYCRAAAGNAVAAYDIAEIFREGYVVNSQGPGGRIITKHYLSDFPTAFYWYQLSAKRGFTKAMLALAQFYALGDEKLKGSHVPRDPDMAWSWVNKAAEKGDTVALLMRWYFYTGLRPAPWEINIAKPADASVRGKASLGAAIEILTRFNPDCNNPDAVKDMADQLPEASEGRQPLWASVAEVHGDTDKAPMEADCILVLGDAPREQQDEPVVNHFYRLIHGGAVRTWSFSMTQIPGIAQSALMRETATQAMTEGIQEMQLLVQTLYSPGGPRNR